MNRYVIVYIDAILVYSQNETEHAQHVSSAPTFRQD